jgi:predicted negative regulator of RcsB-dependent stress response
MNEKPGRCANSEWYTLALCVVFILGLCIWIGWAYGH